MPPDRYSSRDALNPQVLDAPDGLAIFLRAFEAACHRVDPEIATTVEALDGHSYLLEYIVSGTLRVLNISSSTLPGLIIVSCSDGGGGIRQVLKAGGLRVSYINKAKYECPWYATRPEIFIFAAFLGVSTHCQITLQPPRVPENSKTFVRYSTGSREERH